MKEFSKSNLLSRAIEIRPKNELVGHLSELSLQIPSGIFVVIEIFMVYSGLDCGCHMLQPRVLNGIWECVRILVLLIPTIL